LSNFDDNAFDIVDFNFDIDYRQKWEERLEFNDVVSFDSCEGMPPLSGSRRDDSSSDDSFTTSQRKNDTFTSMPPLCIPRRDDSSSDDSYITHQSKNDSSVEQC
jgi:hypothetical protein